MSGGERAAGGAGTETGARGERTRGKRGAEGRGNGPASRARGRALYANEAGWAGQLRVVCK